MEENKIKVYAKLDENNVIISINSSIFLKDTTDYIEIDEGKGDKFVHAQGNYLSKGLIDEQGRYNYKYVDETLVEWTEEEKQEKYPLISNEKTAQEEKLNNMILMSTRLTFLNELPDELAVEIPLMYTSWNDYEDGFEFTENKDRVEYNSKLWKCKKTHQKQASWYPGADPTLFIQLDKDEHKGTLEDPIPVPDSVSTSGFEYIVGKYYLEGEDKYLCKRDGMEDGETIELFFMPSNLIGQYFEKVS